MRLILLLALIAVIYFVFFDERDAWIAFVYPDQTNDLIYQTIFDLDSYEDCRAEAIEMMGMMNWNEAVYECGRDCEYQSILGIYVCEEMRPNLTFF